jgi:hypothetical protein
MEMARKLMTEEESLMLSKQEEQSERLSVLRNDAQVRGATFSDFAQADASEVRGRFTAHERSTVIGSAPSPATQYPAGPNWTCDPVPPEEPLGYSVEDHEPVGQPHELKASTPSLELPWLKATHPVPRRLITLHLLPSRMLSGAMWGRTFLRTFTGEHRWPRSSR